MSDNPASKQGATEVGFSHLAKLPDPALSAENATLWHSRHGGETTNSGNSDAARLRDFSMRKTSKLECGKGAGWSSAAKCE